MPLGILIFIGVLLTVDESREAATAIDVVGAPLSVLTFAPARLRADRGPHATAGGSTDTPLTIGDCTWPWDLSPVPIAFAIAAARASSPSSPGAATGERSGKSALLAFALFRIPSFRNGNIAAMVVSLGEFGIILALPLWLQFVLGFDALQTGFLLLALAIGSFVASGFAGAISGRFSPVWIVRVGPHRRDRRRRGGRVRHRPGCRVGAAHPGALRLRASASAWPPRSSPGSCSPTSPSQSGQASGTQSTSRQVGVRARHRDPRHDPLHEHRRRLLRVNSTTGILPSRSATRSSRRSSTARARRSRRSRRSHRMPRRRRARRSATPRATRPSRPRASSQSGSSPRCRWARGAGRSTTARRQRPAAARPAATTDGDGEPGEAVRAARGDGPD